MPWRERLTEQLNDIMNRNGCGQYTPDAMNACRAKLTQQLEVLEREADPNKREERWQRSRDIHDMGYYHNLLTQPGGRSAALGTPRERAKHAAEEILNAYGCSRKTTHAKIDKCLTKMERKLQDLQIEGDPNRGPEAHRIQRDIRQLQEHQSVLAQPRGRGGSTKKTRRAST